MVVLVVFVAVEEEQEEEEKEEEQARLYAVVALLWPSDAGERPVGEVVSPLLLGVPTPPVAKGLVIKLQEQAGHCRGSLSSLVLRDDLRSQCLREKMGMSKKAQYRWTLILALLIFDSCQYGSREQPRKGGRGDEDGKKPLAC